MRSQTRGFTLIEVMISMGVMAIGLLGIVVGLIAANQTLHDGQIRQYEMEVLDAHSQADLPVPTKSNLLQNQTPASLGTAPPSAKLPVNTGGWGADLSTAGTDLSTGYLFYLAPNGQALALPDAGTATSTSACTTAPSGLYCRELAFTAYDGGSGHGTGYVISARVFKVGEFAATHTLDHSVSSAEVIIQ